MKEIIFKYIWSSSHFVPQGSARDQINWCKKKSPRSRKCLHILCRWLWSCQRRYIYYEKSTAYIWLSWNFRGKSFEVQREQRCFQNSWTYKDQAFQNNVLWTEESKSFLTWQQACLMKAKAKFDRLQGFSL